jgi:hypothetical protein
MGRKLDTGDALGPLSTRHPVARWDFYALPFGFVLPSARLRSGHDEGIAVPADPDPHLRNLDPILVLLIRLVRKGHADQLRVRQHAVRSLGLRLTQQQLASNALQLAQSVRIGQSWQITPMARACRAVICSGSVVQGRSPRSTHAPAAIQAVSANRPRRLVLVVVMRPRPERGR